MGACDEVVLYFIQWSHEHVAGRGTHDLAEVVGFDLAADCAHMCVECANAYYDVGGQTETGRPFGGDPARGLIGSIGLFVEPCGKSF